MATIALSAAGMALGGSIGGSVLGLSMATIGRAAGASIGQRIDQQLLGGGSAAVESGRIDRFRLTGGTEGADVQQIYGRMRVAGQVIWASQFKEQSSTSGGGKGGGSQPTVTDFSYSVSLAIAICDGPVSRIGRIWADGTEVPAERLNMTLYAGDFDQQPDPKIAAVEGLANTPAYRGTAYVMLEDLALGQFGNRIPQLTFEVMRATPDQTDVLTQISALQLACSGGAYTLATQSLHLTRPDGTTVAINTNTPMGTTDFNVSLQAMTAELPGVKSVNLPVAWFADELRCNHTVIQPMATVDDADADGIAWSVAGVTLADAALLPQDGTTPIHATTPADASVVQAIIAMKERDLAITFTPQLIMMQPAGNNLPDPYSGDVGQPQQPWCGLITASIADGVAGSPVGTSLAADEVAAFFGSATVLDFTVSGTNISYNGSDTAGYRRFILHYALLCAASGGVDAFCIGSDLGGLTSVRDDVGGFPAIDALRALASEVREILGADCNITYAADWLELQGYIPPDTADRYFPLDALWADPDIDMVGMNLRMPLSDWRNVENHADSHFGAVHDMGYLSGNVAGGEGFDWHYPTPEARGAQRRVPCTDPSGEDWMARPKDFAGWWGNAHYPRIDGVRQSQPTAWMPQSKPIWFMQLGCAAVDLGSNEIQPQLNAAALPHYSNGNRDDLIQLHYLQAVLAHYGAATNNPVSRIFDGRMIDQNHLYVRSWDPRPYPYWPGNQAIWQDGNSYTTGTFLNGRATNRTLASVVAEICRMSGVQHFDVTGLFGVVRGYTVSSIGTGRSALQPLMLAYGFDATERDGVLVFRNRRAVVDHTLADSALARDPENDQAISHARAAAAEIAGRVKLAHLDADGDYDAIAAEAILPDESTIGITQSELPLALTRKEGERMVTRWLQEARVARDTVNFALPPSFSDVGVGDTVRLQGKMNNDVYRIDRIDENGPRLIEAARIDPEIYRSQPDRDGPVSLRPYAGPVPVEMLFLDLPLLTGDELPHAPYVACSANPWLGNIAVYDAPQDSDYALRDTFQQAATVGVTKSALDRGPVGIWDRQDQLRVALKAGAFSSASNEALLAGANTIAIGDASPDNWEVVQFRRSEPVGEGEYLLRGLLRGQLGTWGVMPDSWAIGSTVVLLDGVPRQLALSAAARGIARHFRYGPAQRPLGDASYRHSVQSFAGIGLRPYPVVHLHGNSVENDCQLSWIRCTRIDGDIWANDEVPLGEDGEAYVLRISKAGQIVREVAVGSPSWTYSEAQMDSDGVGSSFEVAVAQRSDRFGLGPFTTVTVTL